MADLIRFQLLIASYKSIKDYIKRHKTLTKVNISSLSIINTRSSSRRKMLPKQVKRKIHQLNYMQCPKSGHQCQELSFICLNQECENNRLSCCHCDFSEHPDHFLMPLKIYITHIYQQRHKANPHILHSPHEIHLQNIPKTQHPTVNYLSFIESIQNSKNATIQSLHILKQKILQQISQLQTSVEINANKYIQKIILISQTYFSNQDLVTKLNHLKQNPTKAQKIIQQFLENMPPPSKNYSNLQFNQTQSSEQNETQNCQEQFNEICDAFQKRITNLQKSLAKFDLSFFPKLSKVIEYLNIKFSNITSYEWDPLYKSQGFQIIGKDKQIIRVQFQSPNSERVALMKTGIKKESKNKIAWAIKINKLTGWIGVGLGLRKVIVNAKYKFNYNTPGHGMYITSGNGYTWSHSSTEQNSKYQGFSFLTGDVILMQYDPLTRELLFRKYDGKEGTATKVLKIAEYQNEDYLCPCVNMLSKNDEVEIVPVPLVY